MYTRQNLTVGLILAISMVGISHDADGILPGDGLSESTAYLIEDLTDFDVFADPANAATYWSSGVYTKLVCDIDLAGRPYTTAVIAPDTPDTNYNFNGISFKGVFDGDGHTISNLAIDTAGADNDYLGLFDRIESSGAQVKNLGIENINITGGAYSDRLGGLCGENEHVAITDCYATGSVTGDEDLGGLCGRNWYGTITNSYATGSVTGGYGLGGLCGYNSGTITNCFWDVETSGIGIEGDDNYGATGKTTEQMQTESTFTDAGWDFSGETVNGIEDIWQMCDIGGYPKLWWESCPLKVEMKMTPTTLNCRSHGKWIKAHLTLPEGFGVSGVNTPLHLEPLGLESDQVKVSTCEDGLVKIQAMFKRSDFCGATNDGLESLMVIGRLINGESFYGTAKVRIITPGLEELVELSTYWLEAGCKKPHWC
ncbi:MAG: hypothetical protein KAJ52_09480, partial [Sedimentisphaerales bacterium]|nr:hypothetical protein [Sedimentisphaerales bacterium]